MERLNRERTRGAFGTAAGWRIETSDENQISRGGGLFDEYGNPEPGAYTGTTEMCKDGMIAAY